MWAPPPNPPAPPPGAARPPARLHPDIGKHNGPTDPSANISSYGETYIKKNVLQSEVMQGLIDNIKYK